jgi:hypothetical protein
LNGGCGEGVSEMDPDTAWDCCNLFSLKYKSAESAGEDIWITNESLSSRQSPRGQHAWNAPRQLAHEARGWEAWSAPTLVLHLVSVISLQYLASSTHPKHSVKN